MREPEMRRLWDWSEAVAGGGKTPESALFRFGRRYVQRSRTGLQASAGGPRQRWRVAPGIEGAAWFGVVLCADHISVVLYASVTVLFCAAAPLSRRR